MVKSMYAAVAGLRTHQAKMDVIGNNIANVNTFAFKKARAAFRDQFYATMRGPSEAGDIYGGGNPSQVGYGSSLHSVDVDFGTASGAPTGNGMDVMINGNGFFLVGTYAAGAQGGYGTSTAVSDDLKSMYLTRVGIFNIDGQGNLVDASKFHVYGYMVSSDGDPTSPLYNLDLLNGGADADPLKIEALHVPWTMFDGNGKVITHSKKLDDQALIDYTDAYNNYFQLAGTTAAKTEADFAGKAIQVLWGIDDNSYTTGIVPEAGDVAGQYIRDDKLIHSQLAGPCGKVSVNMSAFLSQDVHLAGYNPEDPTNPDNTVYIAPMKLTNISIGDNGVIIGVYQDTREVVTVGQIIIADVPNPNALENIVNGYYQAKSNTGIITAEKPGGGSTGQLSAGRLEMANVDLAQEFTEMITTQRGFQANGRIITVTDEMLAELVNLKR